MVFMLPELLSPMLRAQTSLKASFFTARADRDMHSVVLELGQDSRAKSWMSNMLVPGHGLTLSLPSISMPWVPSNFV